MAQTIEIYGKANANILGGEVAGDTFAIDFLSDTMKCALTTASHTPNLDTHEAFSDLTNEVVGTGYTAGGATLGTKTITYTAANSWATVWTSAGVHEVGDIVRPTSGNGHLFRCVVAGTSHTVEPTWVVTPQRETAEGAGTVRWVEIGRGMVQMDCADISWTTSTITARWGHIYKSGGGDPLMALLDFDGSISTTAGTFLITIPVLGLWQSFAVHRGV